MFLHKKVSRWFLSKENHHLKTTTGHPFVKLLNICRSQMHFLNESLSLRTLNFSLVIPQLAGAPMIISRQDVLWIRCPRSIFSETHHLKLSIYLSKFMSREWYLTWQSDPLYFAHCKHWAQTFDSLSAGNEFGCFKCCAVHIRMRQTFFSVITRPSMSNSCWQ